MVLPGGTGNGLGWTYTWGSWSGPWLGWGQVQGWTGLMIRVMAGLGSGLGLDLSHDQGHGWARVRVRSRVGPVS